MWYVTLELSFHQDTKCSRTIRCDLWSEYTSIWVILHGNICFFITDAEVVSLSRAQVHMFSGSVLFLGKMHHNPFSNAGMKLTWFKSFITIQNLGGATFFGIRELFSGCNTFLVDQNTRTSHKSLAQDLCRVLVCRCGVCLKFSWVRSKFGQSPVRRTPPLPKPPGFTTA